MMITPTTQTTASTRAEKYVSDGIRIVRLSASLFANSIGVEERYVLKAALQDCEGKLPLRDPDDD